MTEVIKLVDKDLETGIINALNIISYWDFSGGKKSIYNARELGSIPGLGRSPGEGNGNSLQYSCLENSMDRGAWQTIQSIGSQNRTWLSNLTQQSVIKWKIQT